MELIIDNIAKIKHAEIKLKGITVIAGNNDTGKSTVGKVLFSMFNSLNNIEDKLKKRESLIINLSEEKERLQRQFNDKQMDFVEFQNSTQHIIDILHKKLLSIDKEKNYLFDNQNSNINEINLL